MVRLTSDILLQADNYLNAYQDREINLRGLKIPTIENLSVLQDQYDVIDFTDNDLKKLDNFPIMKRLTTLLLANNQISRIASTLGDYLPSVSALILTNNNIAHFQEIDHLMMSFCKANKATLTILSLLENPIVYKANYRLYTIFRLPSLKVLDYAKVTVQERVEAEKLFSSQVGKAFLTAMMISNQSSMQQQQVQQQQLVGNSSSSATSLSASANNSSSKPPPPPPPPLPPSSSSSSSSAGQPAAAAITLTEEQKKQVRTAIEQAKTKEEIDVIEYQISTGSFPFSTTPSNGNGNGNHDGTAKPSSPKSADSDKDKNISDNSKEKDGEGIVAEESIVELAAAAVVSNSGRKKKRKAAEKAIEVDID